MIPERESILDTTIPQLLIYYFAFGPLLAYVTVRYFQSGYYNIAATGTYIALFFVVVGKIIKRQPVKIEIPGYIVALFLFAIYTIFSDVFIVGGNLTPIYLYQHRVLTSALILVVIENMWLSDFFVKRLLGISYFFALLAIATLLIQQTIDPGFLVAPSDLADIINADVANQRYPSIYSWMGGKLNYGFNFVPVFAVYICALLKKDRRNVAFFLAVFGALAVFFHRSRWVMLNYAMILLLFFIYGKARLYRAIKYSILLLIIFLLSISFLPLEKLPFLDIIHNRIFAEGDVTKIGLTRQYAFVFFARLFPEHPLLGVGSQKYGLSSTGRNPEALERLITASPITTSQLHVGYLALFYRYGILGGMLFVLFLIMFTKKIYLVAKQSNSWGIFLGFLGFLLANLSLVTFSLFWQGLVIVIVYYKYLERQIAYSGQ